MNIQNKLFSFLDKLETSNRFLVVLWLWIAFRLIHIGIQYYQQPIDGDIFGIIAPYESCRKVLKDPFGLELIINHEKYCGAGRYFVHAELYYYYRIIPIAFNYIGIDSISSIYLSNVFICLIVVFLLIWLNLSYLNIYFSLNKLHKTLVVLSVVCFLTLNYFFITIGILDKSVNYIFAYALPLCLLAFYYLPFVKSFVHSNSRISIFNHIKSILFAIFLAFNGPLIQPIVLIILGLIFARVIYYPQSNLKEFILKKDILSQFLFFGALCLYGFYISSFNAENHQEMPLLKRYDLLFNGIIQMLTTNFTGIFVSSWLLIQFWIFSSYISLYTSKIRTIWKSIFVFSFIYIMLLPMGGYRFYRPYFIRYDTAMPVTFLLLFGTLITFVSNCLFVQDIKLKRVLVVSSLISCLTFTLFDLELELGRNKCERESIETIRASNEIEITVPKNCTIATWNIEGLSYPYLLEAHQTLYRHWRIIDSNQVLR